MIRRFVLPEILMAIFMLFVFLTFSGCAINSAKSGVEGQGNKITVASDVQSDFDLASQLIDDQEYSAAIALLLNVVNKEKRLAAPYYNLAMAYRYNGEEKQVEETLQKAIAIESSHPESNNELGILYRKQGKFSDARSSYNNALAEHPDYLPIIRNLGILCDLYMRDPKCALEQFERYQEQVPEDKTIKAWIADLKTRI